MLLYVREIIVDSSFQDHMRVHLYFKGRNLYFRLLLTMSGVMAQRMH